MGLTQIVSRDLIRMLSGRELQRSGARLTAATEVSDHDVSPECEYVVLVFDYI